MLASQLRSLSQSYSHKGSPAALELTLAPRRRFEAIDVNARIAREARDVLRRHPRTLYCSLHTTAGYVEQRVSARLRHSHDRLSKFVASFGDLFPQGAEYSHDRMELRAELSEAQKSIEPRNGDSHLTFIGAGLRNCVTYQNRPDAPVYFIDLDGASAVARRRRTTMVLGYDHERIVARASVGVRVSKHPIDAVNLADPRFGLLDQVNALLARAGVERGRVDLMLEPIERHVGLTVNEYETLLMKHDLVEVLRNPLRFATKGLRLVAKMMAVPARRFIRSRRVSFLAACEPGGSTARVVRGTYQSPILVQWRPAERQERRLTIAIVELSVASK
jgi:thiamine phosphate synthase YjbQ (UPF0047 family)